MTGANGPGFPLAGVTVVEVSGGAASAMAGRLLAGYGADVIRVEPPDGDPLRHQGAMTELGSATHLYLNGGKTMRMIDTESPAGLAELTRLIESADQVITDQPAAERDKLGLGSEFRTRFGSTSLVVVTPYGTSGPHRDWQSTDLTESASGGQMSLTGEPDREPLKPYGNQAEAQAAFHVLAAVLESQLRWMRSRTASVVDISVQEVQASALEFQGPMAFNRQLFPGVSSRTGNNVRTLWSQYRCQDGWVGVFINPPNLKAFFTLIGHPEMLERLTDEEFLNGELRELVTNWCAARTKQEVFDAAVEFGAPLSYVAAPADVLASETIAATGFWRDVEHPGHGPIRVPGSPFSSTEMSFQLTAAAPPISQGAK